MFDTKEAIESSAVEALDVLLNFIGQEFSDDQVDESEREILVEIRGRLAEFARFRDEKMQEVIAEIEKIQANFGHVIECPSCLQEALIADVLVRCLFCHYSEEAEKAADFYIANVLGESKYTITKDGGDYPHYWCPNCDNHALVNGGITGGMNPAVQFVCFACGFQWLEGELDFCSECNEPKDPREIFAFRCSDCYRAFVERDNT